MVHALGRLAKSSTDIYASLMLKRALLAIAIMSLLSSCASRLSTVHQTNPIFQGLGKVTYDSVPYTSTSVEYNSSSSLSVSQSVTDSSGYRWTITIPAGATSSRVKIKLSALSHVLGPSGLRIVSGIKITPSNLIFSKPATLYSLARMGTPSIVSYYNEISGTSSLQYGVATRLGTVNVLSTGTYFGAIRTPNPSLVASRLSSTISSINHVRTQVLSLQANIPKSKFTCNNSVGSYNPRFESYLTYIQEPQRSYILALAGAVETALVTGASSESTSSNIEAVKTIADQISQIANRLGLLIHKNWTDSHSYLALSFSAHSLSSLEEIGLAISPTSSVITNNDHLSQLFSLLTKWKSELDKACKG